MRVKHQQGPLLAFPPKEGRQTLQGYVRIHLDQFERALGGGLPYEDLTQSVRAAGFKDCTIPWLRLAVFRARRQLGRRVIDPAPQSSGESAAGPSTQVLHEPASGANAPKRGEAGKFGKRYYELLRRPLPGSDEPDPLV
jgi:hypothetical protein